MAENQVYLIKSGSNSFVEETQAIVGISGGKVGIGTTAPEADLHVTGSVKIGGDLAVDGTFTTINSSTVSVDDKNIELGSTDNPTDVTADGGGITVKGATDKTFNWIDATDAWTSSEHLHLAAGKSFVSDGIRALGANGLNIGDDAGNGIFVQDGGKVGIATTNPGYDLDVDGSGNFASLYVDGNAVLTGEGSIFGKWEDGAVQGEIFYTGGNVGVGTNNPEYPLHVVGNSVVDGNFVVNGTSGNFNVSDFNVSGDSIVLNYGGGSLTSNRGGIIVKDSSFANKTFEYVEGSDYWNSNVGLNITNGGINAASVSAVDANGLTLGDDAGNGIFVQDGGKVGIATTNPGYDLDVDGSGNFASLYIQGNSVLTGDSSIFGKWEDATTAGEIYYNGGHVGVGVVDPSAQLHVVGTTLLNGNVSASTIKAIDAGGLTLGDDAGNGIFVEDGGQIGINTTSPGYNLHVNGSTHVGGEFSVGNEFKISAGGAVGGTAPASDGDIIKWDDANNKWVAGANVGGGGGGGVGEVPLATINSLPSGQSIYEIEFAETYNVEPRIATQLEIDGEGSIIPYVVSGVSTSGYHLIFAQDIPNNNYRIHTTFGGRDVHWETGSSASLYYNDGDVSIQRNFTIGGNLTVNGTTTTVNTETVEIEDHNLVIAANTGYNQLTNEYPGAGGAYAGILWGTGDAGAASPVSLTYQTSKGFAFEGGNVGIGTTNPSAKLSITNGGAEGVEIQPGLSSGLNRITNFNRTTSTYNKLAIDASEIDLKASGSSVVAVSGSVLTVNPDSLDYDFHVKPDTGVGMFVQGSSGNVGIGTTNPGSKLEVYQELEANDVGDSILTVTNTRLNTGSSSATIGFITDEVDGSTADKRAQISASYDGTNGGKLVLSTHNGTSLNQALTIKNDGNVGIGTTNPGSLLEVYSNSGVGNTQIHIHNDSTGNAAVLRLEGGRDTTDSNVYQDVGQVLFVNKGNITAGIRSYHQGDGQSSGNDFDDGDLRFLTSDHGSSNVLSTRMVINKSGNVGIGTTNPGAEFEVNGQIISNRRFMSENSLELVSDYNDNGSTSIISFKIDGQDAGNEKMRITSAGNVGIGTTNPGNKLHIAQGTLVGGSTNSNTSLTIEDALNTGIQFLSATQTQLRFGDADSDGAGSIIYQHTDNLLRLNTTGAIALQGGNVGIGTTNPSKQLHIEDTNANFPGIKISASDLNYEHEVKANGDGLLISADSTNYGGAGPDIRFNVSGSEHMRINKSGNVGIGTTNPTNGKLEILNPTATVATTDSVDLAITQNASGTSSKVQLRAGVTSGDDPYFSIRTRNRNDASSEPGVIKERMRITHTGNVGIGTTNPSEILHVGKSSGTTLVKTEVATNSVVGFDIKKTGTTNQEWRIVDGQTINGKLEIYDVTDSRSVMAFDGDGNVGIGTTNPSRKLHVFEEGDSSESMAMFVRNDSSHTNSTIAGFHGTSDYVLQIKSNGNVGMGTYTPTNRLHIVSDASTQAMFLSRPSGGVCTMNRDTTDGHVLRFEKNGVLVGHISTNSNSLPSDRNFKRNISDLELGLDFVNKLKPSVYNYKIDDEDCPVHYGLIAQDVESALEECGVEKNSSLMLQHSPTEKEEESDYSLDYGKLVPVLTKAIQEQQQMIEDLKSQNASLESRISALES